MMGFMETDTVIYDKLAISVEEMEMALMKAGTYRKIMTGE
jgi:hypothetical protein